MSGIPTTELLPAVRASALIDALHGVYDPELAIDVVRLGLVYGVAIVAGDVVVSMTLTSPGCPMGTVIEDDVRATLLRLPGVRSVDVQLCWDPPWSPAALSEDAKRTLGWLA